MRFSPDAVFHGLGRTPDLATTISLANKSKECYELSETEAGWNNFVHAPLLELARESAFAPSAVRIACLLVASFHFTSPPLFFFFSNGLAFYSHLHLMPTILACSRCLLFPHLSSLALLASCLFFYLLRMFYIAPPPAYSLPTWSRYSTPATLTRTSWSTLPSP